MSLKTEVNEFLQHFKSGVEPWIEPSFCEDAAKQGYLQVSNHENDSCEIRVSFVEDFAILRVLGHDMQVTTYQEFAICLVASLRAVDNADIQQFAELANDFEPADFI